MFIDCTNNMMHLVLLLILSPILEVVSKIQYSEKNIMLLQQYVSQP